jgi:acyl-CoA synthetase (AMP-forming)/AMP-acid ligase II
MNIREFLERQAERYSGKVFLYFEDERVTYEGFNRTVNRMAVMLPNSPAFLYTWMGLNKIGSVAVPLNINFKEREVEYILQHSEACGIVMHKDYYQILSGIKKEKLPRLRQRVVVGDDVPPGTTPFSSLLNESDDPADVRISGEDPAVCIYTSGTTDRPKGVLNSHKNWVLTGEAYAFMVGITREDRVMTSNPLYHANAQAYSVMSSMAAGASLILLEKFSASRILEQARRYEATKLVLVQAVTPAS